jgi:hypothetical protein
MKKVELTGSPKDAGFKTKASLLDKLEDFGYSQSKMKKRGNDVDILLTDDPDSTTKKMELAKELGVEIMTYDEIADLFDLERDI